MTLALLASAFWAGMHVQRLGAEHRCQQAGGTVAPNGLCRGLP
ncbi:MAG: hypothetical protein QNJ20_13935 [Paracoccaceae bacterium]|nr:hypothetical protein [Paracoccaceae bacterium]